MKEENAENFESTESWSFFFKALFESSWCNNQERTTSPFLKGSVQCLLESRLPSEAHPLTSSCLAIGENRLETKRDSTRSSTQLLFFFWATEGNSSSFFFHCFTDQQKKKNGRYNYVFPWSSLAHPKASPFLQRVCVPSSVWGGMDKRFSFEIEGKKKCYANSQSV